MPVRLLRTPRAETEVGCIFPLVALLAAAIAVGVAIGLQLFPSGTVGPREAVVRVIDDGATGGPRVLSTQVVPLR